MNDSQKQLDLFQKFAERRNTEIHIGKTRVWEVHHDRATMIGVSIGHATMYMLIVMMTV